MRTPTLRKPYFAPGCRPTLSLRTTKTSRTGSQGIAPTPPTPLATVSLHNLMPVEAIVYCIMRGYDEWLTIGRGTSDTYCKLHRQRIRKGSSVGTQSQTRLCVCCGAYRVGTKLCDTERRSLVRFTKVLAQIEALKLPFITESKLGYTRENGCLHRRTTQRDALDHYSSCGPEHSRPGHVRLP